MINTYWEIGFFNNIESYSTRTEVVESFGAPDIEKNEFVKYYLCKSKYIHFEFNSDGELHLITLGYTE